MTGFIETVLDITNLILILIDNNGYKSINGELTLKSITKEKKECHQHNVSRTVSVKNTDGKERSVL